LAQWTFWSRKENLLNFAKAAKKSVGDLNTQLEFLWKELQGYTGVMKVLNAAKSVREASDVVLLEYERPADQTEPVRVRRAGYGQGYFDKFAGAAPTTPVQPPQTAAPFEPYLVRVQPGTTIYKGAGTATGTNGSIREGGAFTIVEESNGYGRLKSGAGWISLGSTTKVGQTAAPAPPPLKTNDEIALEVIAGKWGNGQDRINRLTAAGYNASAVQAVVNQLLKK
jgi:hypothetical protein